MLRSNRRSGTPTSLAEASPSPRKDAPRTGPATPRSSTLSRPGLSPTHRDLQVPHRTPQTPPVHPHPSLPPSRGKGSNSAAPHLPSRLCKGLLVGRGRAEARISHPQTLLQRHPRRLRQGLTHRDPGTTAPCTVQFFPLTPNPEHSWGNPHAPALAALRPCTSRFPAAPYPTGAPPTGMNHGRMEAPQGTICRTEHASC